MKNIKSKNTFLVSIQLNISLRFLEKCKFSWINVIQQVSGRPNLTSALCMHGRLRPNATRRSSMHRKYDIEMRSVARGTLCPPLSTVYQQNWSLLQAEYAKWNKSTVDGLITRRAATEEYRRSIAKYWTCPRDNQFLPPLCSSNKMYPPLNWR